jgi:hypothetical protein
MSVLPKATKIRASGKAVLNLPTVVPTEAVLSACERYGSLEAKPPVSSIISGVAIFSLTSVIISSNVAGGVSHLSEPYFGAGF